MAANNINTKSLNYIHFHPIHICTQIIHAGLNILFYLLPALNEILLNSKFYFIWNTYSSIWIINTVITSTAFININTTRLIRVYIKKSWSRLTGQLFKDTNFMLLFGIRG